MRKMFYCCQSTYQDKNSSNWPISIKVKTISTEETVQLSTFMSTLHSTRDRRKAEKNELIFGCDHVMGVPLKGPHFNLPCHRVSSSSVVKASDLITERIGFKSHLELSFFPKNYAKLCTSMKAYRSFFARSLIRDNLVLSTGLLM